MALLEVNWTPGRRELRQFSLLWIAFFGLIGVYFFWAKGATTAATVFWILAAIGPIGYFFPNVMRPIYVAWMALVLPIGFVVSHTLLLFVYYLVLTPIGLIMRVVGYDPMQRQIDRNAKTYWTPHDPAADSARFFKQY